MKNTLCIYEEALTKFGFVNQEFMLIEECGELLNAIAKIKRGRSTRKDIITELADVHIMVEQMACYYGWGDFCEQRQYKLERLQDRLSNQKEGGQTNDPICS